MSDWQICYFCVVGYLRRQSAKLLFAVDNLLLPNVMGFKLKTFGYKFIVGTFTLTEYRCNVIKVPT